MNFIDRPDSPDEVGKFIYSEVERQLREKYDVVLTDNNFVRGVLHFDLERFSHSPEGTLYQRGSVEYRLEELKFIQSVRADTHTFLRKVLQHVRAGRGFSVAMFFDNLDRRNEPIQEEAFLRASAIARDWACLVFVCLRPVTYFRSKSLGVMDSVAPKVVNIVSPKTNLLVSKRLAFARELALGETAPVGFNPAVFNASMALTLPTVAEFLKCCADSFERGRKLCNVFDAVSNGNARELLNYVYQFITSLHLNTDKILSAYRSPDGYLLADHEALRTLLYGDSWHYDPIRSAFVNLFDIQRSDRIEHFTRYLALHHLNVVSTMPPTHGFCLVDEVVRYLCQLGYSEENGRQNLRYLWERKCCESREPVEDWDGVKSLRVTTLGKYHVSVLVNTFSYIDAVVVDTPVLDASVRGRIWDAKAIRDRLDRCPLFLDYLNGCMADIQDERCRQLWKETYDSVRDDIQRIWGRVNALR